MDQLAKIGKPLPALELSQLEIAQALLISVELVNKLLIAY